MSNQNKLALLLILSISMAINSCSTQNAPTSELTSPIAPTLSPTNIPTKIPTATSEPDLTNLITSCAEILDAPPKDIKPRNSLVLTNLSSGSYILNLETNRQISLGVEAGNEELIVSPNMQKIAFINSDTEKLIFVDVNGKELETINGYDWHFSLIQWLDNENVAIDKANDKDSPLYNHSLLVFNTITSAKKEFHIEDFPNVNNDYRYRRVFPNAQLTKLIYFVEGNTISPAGYDGTPIVLWDILSGSEIKRIYFSDSFSWSHDGNKLLITAPIKFDEFVNFANDLPYKGGDEIFIVDDKGEMKRLTYLTTKYETSLSVASSWSPTEGYIALEMYNKNDPDFGLSILNINTGEIRNYCIHGEWGGVFWSPDSNQIAFTIWDGTNTSKPKVYILDLKKKLAFKIEDDAILEGWLINK